MSSRSGEIWSRWRAWGETHTTRQGLILDLGLAVFGAAMVWSMIVSPGLETVPYHLLFLMLTIIYGFRVWPVLPTTVVATLVTLATGGVLYLHYRQGFIDRAELAEVLLMPALLMAMVWHARRRVAAQTALQEMTVQQQAMIEREHDFFRDTAHAIRTPVTIARGHLELSEEAIEEPQAQEDVRVALRQLERMAVLSNRLLAIAQLDAGTSFPVEQVSLRDFILDVGGNWAAHTNRSWTVVCPDDAVILAAPDMLGLALDAVIENAVHFTGDGGTIALTGKVWARYCTVRVADDGPGIPPEDLGRVFERFWHRRPPNGSMGSGLGLPMAIATARACGGSLRAFNQEGGGAAFEFVLPIASATLGDPVPASVSA
ncbi:sensor histidine kinase [Nocardioides sp.]|uniref:sensor histidine kinase n=1 Tax=Nocardioides sp. TaxID=35761 RepID=UPI003D11BB1E